MPWQSTTSPSSHPRPKSIVLTRDIFQCGLNQSQWLAIIHWLQQRGFDLYLCVYNEEGKTDFVSCQSANKDEIYKLLYKFTAFEEADYENLAEQCKVEKDRVTVLNKEMSQQLIEFLFEDTRHVYNNQLLDCNVFKIAQPLLVKTMENGTISTATRKEVEKKSASEIDAENQNFISDYVALKKYLKQHEANRDIQLSVIKTHLDRIANIDNLMDCLINFPHLIKDTNWKSVLDRVIKKADAISINDFLEQILKILPNEATNLFDHFNSSIKTTTEFLILLKLSEYVKIPIKDIILKYADHIINSISDIEAIIKFYPSLKEDLFNYFKLHSSSITIEKSNLLNGKIAIMGIAQFVKLIEWFHPTEEQLNRWIKGFDFSGGDIASIIPEIENSSLIELSNREIYLKVLLEQFSSSKDMNYTYLFKWVKACPNLVKDIVTKHWEIILNEIKYEIQINTGLEDIIKLFPDRADELFTTCTKENNLSDALLLDLFKCYPYKRDELIKKYSHQINKELIENYSDSIANFLINNHEFIRNSYCLAACLKCFPEQQDNLLKYHKNKIKKCVELAMCCQFLNITTAKSLIVENYRFVQKKGESGLLTLIDRNRNISDWILKIFNDIFYSNDISINRILKKCPEHIDWLIQQSFRLDVDFDPCKNWQNAQVINDRQFKLSSDLPDASLFPNPPVAISTSPPFTEDTTYLYLGACDNLAHFTRLIEEGKLKHLVVLEISNSIGKNDQEIKQFFAMAMTHCKNLQQILLPIELKELVSQLSNFPYQVQYSGKKPMHNQKEDRQNTEITVSGKVQPGKLYISGNDNLNTEISSKKTDVTYNMVQTGELLNFHKQQLQRIRTGIIELSDDFKSRHYLSAQLIQIESPRVLDEATINGYRKQDDSSNYYLFNIKLPANQKIRLLSIDAQEELLGFKGVNPGKIIFFRGDDGFFYAKSKVPATLTYVIKAPTAEAQAIAYKAIPDNDPIKSIIEDYINHDKFKMADDKNKPLPEIKNNDRKLWLETLYNERAGKCTHRCNAVWYKIIKNLDLKERMHILRVDNNHVQLEIYHEEKWHRVDLGGAEANLSFSEAKVYTPSPSITASQKKSQPTASKQSQIVSSIKTQAQSTQLLSSAAQHIDSVVHQANTLQPLYDEKQLAALLSQKETVLITTTNVEQYANLLLKHATRAKHPVFYLDNKSSVIGKGKEQINLRSGQPEIDISDELDHFIESIRNINTEPSATIVVNWDAFNAQERVALNTIIDRDIHRSVYGKKLPETVQIISLSSTPHHHLDHSFSNRHQQKFIGEIPIQNTVVVTDYQQPIIIDVQGLPDWKAHLFGLVILKNGQLEWQKGLLVQQLERLNNTKENCQIEIRNLPNGAKEAFDYLLKQAWAKGKFHYKGYAIPLSELVRIVARKSTFDFTPFPPIKVKTNIKLTERPANCPLINSILFDYVLQDKKIDDNKNYQTTLGLIANAANTEDRTLSLFITSPLSESQWYCLFKQAEIHKVELQLHLAPGVTLPENCRLQELKEKTEPAHFNMSHIYVTNQPHEIVEKLAKKAAEDDSAQECLCFAIEDYNYQDLVSHIRFDNDKQNKKFHNFEKIKSDLINAIEDKKKVVLYGQFTPELLQALEPLLCTYSNLSLVIEDKAIKAEDKEYSALRWLPSEALHIIEHEIPKAQRAQILYREDMQNQEVIDLTSSKKDADDFINQRKDALYGALSKNNMVQLIGHTGVGKSYLIKELEENDELKANIYHEFNQFEDWAKNNNDKLKILFFDESNIEDKHLTLLDPLKHPSVGSKRPILYKGKLYLLTPDHKVVFGHNKHNYGGGRSEQKLFADETIPELHFSDMPAAFIYERILKRVFDSLLPVIKLKIPEEIFKQDAAVYLDIFLHRKKQASFALTVRALEEWVLNYAAEQHRPYMLLAERVKLWWANKQKANDTLITSAPLDAKKTSYFTPTPSMIPLQVKINNFINNRKQQHENFLPGGMGLNAFLIEGRSGIGKTELIRYSLEQSGYQSGNENKNVQGLKYYKIDASLSRDVKEKRIIQAIEEGNALWIDEINSCIDDGLEKILNTALSGFHPETLQPLKQGGFMLFATANSMGMEGRSAIGPALRGRMVQSPMPLPTADDFEAILNYLLAKQLSKEQFANLDIGLMATDLDILFKKNPHYNLRTISDLLEEIIPAYRFAKQDRLERFKEALAKRHHRTVTTILNSDDDSKVFTAKDHILQLAVELGDVNSVEAVCKSKNCNQDLFTRKNTNGETALHIAAKLDKADITNLLLQHSLCSLDFLMIRDSQGHTALDVAMQSKNSNFVSMILNHPKLTQEDKNALFNPKYLLYILQPAVLNNSVLLVEELLKIVSQNDFPHYATIILELGIKNDNAEIIQSILKHELCTSEFIKHVTKNNIIAISKMASGNDDLMHCILNNNFNLQLDQVLIDKMFIEAASNDNIEVMSWLKYGNSKQCRPTEKCIEIVLSNCKYLPANQGKQALFWLKNSQLNPLEYDKIIESCRKKSGDLSPSTKAILILKDYTEEKVFTSHHHINEVKKILEYITDKTPIYDIIKELKRINLKNETGSLAKCIHYFQYYLANSSQQVENRNVKQTTEHKLHFH